MNKKITICFGVFVCALMCICSLFFLPACSHDEDDGKIHVVCTIFPQYDWTTNIAKDSKNLSVDLIVQNGADLHSFEYSPKDVMTISRCDVLIFCGGESDSDLEKILQGSDVNKSMKKVNLLKILKKNNMALAEIDDPDQFDEHVWLSPLNAKVFVQEILSVLTKVDDLEKELFEANAQSYSQKLDEITQSYQDLKQSVHEKATQKGVEPCIVVADRFPFAYLCDFLNLKSEAAFSGCSAETGADEKTVERLVNFVDDNNLKTILILEKSSNQPLAQTVKNASKAKNQTIAQLNSMQSVTKSEIQNGETFLKIMQSNLNVLGQALAYLN